MHELDINLVTLPPDKQESEMTKNLLLTAAFMLSTLATTAQTADSTAFRAYIYNNEYEVFMRINFYDKDIVVPGQELFGPLPGYLQKERNSFSWLILDAKLTSPSSASLQMINDYGSDDLMAELTQKDDTTYVLRQLSGATLKVPKNGKWQKLPKTIEMKRKK